MNPEFAGIIRPEKEPPSPARMEELRIDRKLHAGPEIARVLGPSSTRSGAFLAKIRKR